jgi:hypothetical protein
MAALQKTQHNGVYFIIYQTKAPDFFDYHSKKPSKINKPIKNDCQNVNTPAQLLFIDLRICIFVHYISDVSA